MQVSGWQGARELHSDHGSVVVYRGMVDCFVRTVREEGFQALFKVGGFRIMLRLNTAGGEFNGEGGGEAA